MKSITRKTVQLWSVFPLRDGLAIAVARSTRLLIGIFLMPIIYNQLGDDAFSVWVTTMSALTIVSFFDFGINCASVSEIAEVKGSPAVSRVIEQRVSLLLRVSIIWSVLVLTIFATGGSIWNLFSLPVVAGLIIAILSLPAQMAQQSRFAMGQNLAGATWEGVGSVTSFLLSCVLIAFKADIFYIISVFLGTKAIIDYTHLFKVLYLHKCSIRSILFLGPSRHGSIGIIKGGMVFLLLQVVGGFYFGFDVLITSVFYPSQAGNMAIAQKVFSVAPFFAGMILMPFWPKIAASNLAGGHVRRQQLLNSAILCGLLFGALSLVLIPIAPSLASLWFGKPLDLDRGLLVATSAWAVMATISGPIAMYANGMKWVRLQMIQSLILLVVMSVAKGLGLLYFGYVGLIWGAVIAHATVVLIPMLLRIRSEDATWLMSTEGSRR